MLSSRPDIFVETGLRHSKADVLSNAIGCMRLLFARVDHMEMQLRAPMPQAVTHTMATAPSAATMQAVSAVAASPMQVRRAHAHRQRELQQILFRLRVLVMAAASPPFLRAEARRVCADARGDGHGADARHGHSATPGHAAAAGHGATACHGATAASHGATAGHAAAAGHAPTAGHATAAVHDSSSNLSPSSGHGWLRPCGQLQYLHERATQLCRLGRADPGTEWLAGPLRTCSRAAFDVPERSYSCADWTSF